MHNAAVDVAKELDRRWFEDNPGRSFMIRDAIDFEFDRVLPEPKPGFSWRVIVAELKPGARVRTPLAARISLSNESATEKDIERIFREVSPSALKYIGPD